MDITQFDSDDVEFLSEKEMDIKNDDIDQYRKNSDSRISVRDVSWSIVAGGVYVLMLWGIVSRCYPIFYFPMMSDLEVSYEEATSISAYLFGAYAISSGISPVLGKLLGYRNTVMGLGMIAGLGLFASSFCKNQVLINILAGVLPGLSIGPILVVYSTGIMVYHTDKLSGALLQVIFLGSAISPTFGAPLLQLFVDWLGWRGAARILGGLFLQLVVFGATIKFDHKDMKTHKVAQDEEYLTEDANNNTKGYDPTAMIIEDVENNNKPSTVHVEDQLQITEKSPAREFWLQRICKTLRLQLFIQPSFIVYTLITCFYAPSYFSCMTFIIPFGIEVLHLSPISATMLITTFIIGDIISKIFHGVFYAQLSLGRRLLFIVIL